MLVKGDTVGIICCSDGRKKEDEVELEEEIDETLITQVPDESFEDAPGSDIEE